MLYEKRNCPAVRNALKVVREQKHITLHSTQAEGTNDTNMPKLQ